jgi:predicted ATPase
LAGHFAWGQDAERSIIFHAQAGQQALARSAHVEAVSYLTTGLELLATLPETPARAQQELALQIALGPALAATKGYTASEVEQTYARGRALCQEVDETPQLFPALWGLGRFYRGRGALQTS